MLFILHNFFFVDFAAVFDEIRKNPFHSHQEVREIHFGGRFMLKIFFHRDKADVAEGGLDYLQPVDENLGTPTWQ